MMILGEMACRGNARLKLLHPSPAEHPELAYSDVSIETEITSYSCAPIERDDHAMEVHPLTLALRRQMRQCCAEICFPSCANPTLSDLGQSIRLIPSYIPIRILLQQSYSPIVIEPGDENNTKSISEWMRRCTANNSRMVFYKRHNIEIVGQGGQNDGVLLLSGLEFHHCHHVRLSNLALQGFGEEKNRMLLKFAGCVRVVISQCCVRGEVEVLKCKHFSCEKNEIACAPSVGLFVVDTSGVKCSNCVIHHNHSNGINVSRSRGYFFHCDIHHNSDPGIYVKNQCDSSLVFEQNTIRENLSNGVNCAGLSCALFQGNLFEKNADPALYVKEGSRPVIVGNVFSNNPSNAVNVDQASCILEDNKFEGNGGPVLFARGAKGMIFKKNISKSNTGNGMVLESSEGLFSGNVFDNGNDEGTVVILENMSSVQFLRNQIRGQGISISTHLSEIKLEDNQLKTHPSKACIVAKESSVNLVKCELDGGNVTLGYSKANMQNNTLRLQSGVQSRKKTTLFTDGNTCVMPRGLKKKDFFTVDGTSHHSLLKNKYLTSPSLSTSSAPSQTSCLPPL